jgi:hypothetical protein
MHTDNERVTVSTRLSSADAERLGQCRHRAAHHFDDVTQAASVFAQLQANVFGVNIPTADAQRGLVIADGEEGDVAIHIRVGMFRDFIDALRPQRQAEHLREEAQLLDAVKKENDEAAARQSERAEREAFVLQQTGHDIPSAADVFAKSAKQTKRGDKSEARAEQRVAMNDDLAMPARRAWLGSHGSVSSSGWCRSSPGEMFAHLAGALRPDGSPGKG